jgi:hypothetical protein
MPKTTEKCPWKVKSSKGTFVIGISVTQAKVLQKSAKGFATRESALGIAQYMSDLKGVPYQVVNDCAE